MAESTKKPHQHVASIAENFQPSHRQLRSSARNCTPTSDSIRAQEPLDNVAVHSHVPPHLQGSDVSMSMTRASVSPAQRDAYEVTNPDNTEEHEDSTLPSLVPSFFFNERLPQSEPSDNFYFSDIAPPSLGLTFMETQILEYFNKDLDIKRAEIERNKRLRMYRIDTKARYLKYKSQHRCSDRYINTGSTNISKS